MGTLFTIIVGKKIKLRERLIIQEALNQFNTSGVVRLTKYILIMTFTIEGIDAALLSIRDYKDRVCSTCRSQNSIT